MAESEIAQGRPRDAGAARAAILAAAERVFAEQGFHGARIDTIAAEAGYNKSLIFQYFGDKLRLYGTVLQRTAEEANALQAQLIAPLVASPDLGSDPSALRAFFKGAFGAIFDHLAARPCLTQILLWEMADGWRTYLQVTPRPSHDELAPLRALFQTAARAGLIRSTFAPGVQLSMALQVCQTYLATLPLHQTLVPDDTLSTPAALALAREYVVELVVGGLLLDPPSASRRARGGPPVSSNQENET